MIKCDTSDRVVIGDSSEPVYLNASTSGGVLLPNDTPITAGWSVATNRVFYKYDSSANEHEVGTSPTGSPAMTIAGRPVSLYSASGAIDISSGYPQFLGVTSYAGAPTTSHFATGTWGIFRDTSGVGHTYLVYNRAGTIEKAELT